MKDNAFDPDAPHPVLMIDIVGFSSKPAETQHRAIRALVSMLHQAIPEDQNNPAARTWRPGLGGGLLVFWESIDAALDTALSLAQKLVDYNREPADAAAVIEVRMGLHTGKVVKEVDFDDAAQPWGDALDICKQITDLARPGQILVSGALYQSARLHESPDEVTYFGKWWVAENQPVEVYNVYVENIAGVLPGEKDGTWYGPFHLPLVRAIKIYESMINECAAAGPAFRAAVLAKRLLDLDPWHMRAKKVIESISRRHAGDASLPLYDEFLSPLPPGALLYFFQNARFSAFKKGEIIAEEREAADALMMVVSGEIVPLRYGVRVQEPDPENPQKARDVVFREGHITGEMGLFNPVGTRTATLAAYTDAVTLTLDYDLLRIEDDLSPPERTNRLAIQNRIWEFYCTRTIETEIFGHPLFKNLSNLQRNRLRSSAKFLPAAYGQPVTLSLDEAWNAWTVVVTGRVLVYSKEGRLVEYGPGDCIGPVRLLVTGEPPFSGVEVAANTHLARFHWLAVRSLLRESEEFRKGALAASSDDMVRFGLI
ncbi:MAG: cyclic nucleotide-binding domain-containing protein [Anaerolineae bacterium]|nr:cyclic nucleotide-binding domain-containing protein [Anaerolineae bacterium]